MLSPDGGTLEEKRGIEVGNIFQLGFHYTNMMNGAEYTDDKGTRQKYYMGCYGIGIARTLAAVVEIHHDDKGIIWPEGIAPAKVYLARLGDKPGTTEVADELYDAFLKKNIDVLYDDRDARPGEKFADADLLGIPYRVVVSDKLVASQQFELKKRGSDEISLLSEDELLAKLS
jgi:prolyl-tRNA synthetase